MWYKRAKVLIDVIVIVGCVLSILLAGGLAFITVSIGYAMPIEGALTIFIILAIAEFIIIAIAGCGISYVSVIGLGLVSEMAENIETIKNNTEKREEQPKTQPQDEYGKYRYR
ncbi:MAG: hypothetical protein J6C06_08055 [Lachnospiraceae bacterium]|nr:hypothetical protein [Lachnospiraceae bacterium]